MEPKQIGFDLSDVKKKLKKLVKIGGERMEKLRIFKIEYSWYEDEHEQVLLAKRVSPDQFEKDISAARQFAEKLRRTKADRSDYLGKGYYLECLPEFFEQIVWLLTNKKGYEPCKFDIDISYDIDDYSKIIGITKKEKTVKQTKIKETKRFQQG